VGSINGVCCFDVLAVMMIMMIYAFIFYRKVVSNMLHVAVNVCVRRHFSRLS